MRMWCLHKYNPTHFDSNGLYVGGDWREVHDIEGHRLRDAPTWEEYIEKEDAYIRCIRYLIELSGETQFEVIRFADNGVPLREINKWGRDIKYADHAYPNGEILSGPLIYDFCRLSLRELQAFALASRGSMFIAFLEDMYVHIGLPATIAIETEKISREGLFLEDVTQMFEEDDLYQKLI